MNRDDAQVAVVGLGDVQVPLAAEFRTLAVKPEELAEAGRPRFNDEPKDMARPNVLIFTTPAPDRQDFEACAFASRAIGGVLQRGDVGLPSRLSIPGQKSKYCFPDLDQIFRLSP